MTSLLFSCTFSPLYHFIRESPSLFQGDVLFEWSFYCIKNEVFQEAVDLVTFTEEILNGFMQCLFVPRRMPQMYCNIGKVKILYTTAPKVTFSVTDFFSKCDQIRSFRSITFVPFIRLSMKFNTFFAIIKLFFSNNNTYFV